MKILAGVIIAIFLLAGTSCQQNINVEKEKEAIMELLKAEGDAALSGDMERVGEIYVHDEMTTRLEMGQYSYNRYEGWEEVESLLGDFLEGEGGLGGDNPVNRKENVIIKVTGNTAWLTCDNIWEWTVDGEKGGYNNIQIQFLEKKKGEWKISFSAYFTKP